MPDRLSWTPAVFLILLAFQAGAQQSSDTVIQKGPLIHNVPLIANERPADSAYVTVLPNLWSVRIFASARNQGNAIRNNQNEENVRYRSTNPLSLGVGFSYKFLLVDLGINMKFKKVDATERFDLQASLYGRKYVSEVFLQFYNGFNLVKAQTPEGGFREDLSTSNIGINIFRAFGGSRLSLRSAFIGSEIQKKAAGTLIVGGFFSNYHLRSDSSIIPPLRSGSFNEFARLDHMDLINFGVGAGYAYSSVFPKNVFLFIAAIPGLGLHFGDLHAEKWYKPPMGPFGKVHLRAALGRNNLKNYQILSYSSDFFLMNIGNDNLYRYHFGKLKFVYGFRLENKKSPLKRIL